MAVVKKATSAKAVQTEKRVTIYQLTKETPGAFQYAEINENGSKKTDMDGAVTGSLYLRKATVKGETPQRIKVTVEWN